MKVETLPNGAARCQFGGVLVSSGLDTNGDGTLQDTEVQSSSAVCSVQVVATVIVATSISSPNPNGSATSTPNANGCLYGGIHQEVGVDLNGDKVLQQNEVTGTSDVCNQVQLISGQNSLLATSAATAQQCAFGGSVIQTGVDTNSNGALDASEIQGSAVVCNGANGFNALVISKISTSCGSRGGIDMQSGLDTNRNGSLDASEVTNSATVCNGFTGSDGHQALVKQSTDSAVCGTNGGIRLDSGTDANNNGLLEPAEVAYTSYICNGQNGAVTLVRATSEPQGTNCANGGVRYDTGADVNANSILDPSEVSATSYICDGAPGWIVDVSQPAEAAVCPNGGVKILVGPDTDGDGALTGAEIMQTSYVCNP